MHSAMSCICLSTTWRSHPVRKQCADAVDNMKRRAEAIAASRESKRCKRARQCAQPGCAKRSVFNHPKETKGLFCAAHKHSGMVNVMAKRCANLGCLKQPAFNQPGQTVGLFCSTHKHDGMVNVKSKRCIHSGCGKIPIFNQPGENIGLYCAVHVRRDPHGRCDLVVRHAYDLYPLQS